MNKCSVVKRTIMAFSLLAIIIAVSSFGSGCFAGNAPNLDQGFEGSWIGQVNSSVVHLNLQQTGKSTLTYETPRSCVLTVKFLIVIRGHNTYFPCQLSIPWEFQGHIA